MLNVKSRNNYINDKNKKEESDASYNKTYEEYKIAKYCQLLKTN